MKKNIFITILILCICIAPAFALDENVFSESESNVQLHSDAVSNPVVANPSDVVFKSSAVEMIDFMNNMDRFNPTSVPGAGGDEFRHSSSVNMPLFKKMRIKAVNHYRSKASNASTTKDWSKIKFWEKKNITSVESIQDENPQETKSDLINSIDNVANIRTSDTIELEGSVTDENVENQLMLDAANISYDNITGEMIATGRPVLFLPAQQTKIVADVMTYDDQGNILKANGDVLIIKDGKVTHSDYLIVNLNEETIDADNMFAEFPKLNITAEHSLQKDGLLIFDKGKMFSDQDGVYRIKTEVGGLGLEDMIIADDEKSLFFGTPEHSIDIKVAKLEIDSRKNHDIITAKKIQFGHDDKYFFKWPSLKVYTNKERDYFEANYPEFGSLPRMGMFIGPGIVFGGPFGSVVKAIPLINYDKKFGVGGMIKYINSNNRTELAYASARNRFILRGKQQLDDDLYLQYGYNSYANDWFLGDRMPKLITELVYNKAFTHQSFLGDNRELTFSHRASFGFMKDNDENLNGEKFNNNSGFSTTRTKYMAQIYQSLYKYENVDKRIKLTAGVILQGSGTIYGSGDTQFIARGGPSVRMQYKNWIQDASYFLSGYQDDTPMPHFDAYRYGTSSFRLLEALRINKYITVGWQTYINLSNDAPNGKNFQENAFLVSLGPDDLKLVLGYDFIRERTYFGVNVAFNPKGTTVKYDKMIIKNPENLNQGGKNEQQVAYVPSIDAGNEQERGLNLFKKSPDKTVLEYAEVIELEDPEKERID